MSNYTEEINRRRTFAIISHPDAGKTTLMGEVFHLLLGKLHMGHRLDVVVAGDSQ